MSRLPQHGVSETHFEQDSPICLACNVSLAQVDLVAEGSTDEMFTGGFDSIVQAATIMKVRIIVM